MEYITLGKTGLRVSKMGFGGIPIQRVDQAAAAALLEAVRSGYITACALEEEGTLLRVDCGDPAGSPGTGTETALWFDASTHALVRGEISVDGFRVILCEFSDFTAG